jgi:predicted nuclease with RNAse H fold
MAAVTGDRLEPLELVPECKRTFPGGLGNGEILRDRPFEQAAEAFSDSLGSLAQDRGFVIARVAIDAPAAPPASGERSAEKTLRQLKLSCFQTPDRGRWLEIRQVCRTHTGKLSRMPHANKVWMLYGFELFRALREHGFEVIEVYPYAIVRALLPQCEHKTTPEGYRSQLTAVAAATRWAPDDLERTLERCVAGSRHDRLDAFMAAWIASLPRDKRRAYGDAEDPDDAIWVHRA